MYCPKCGKESIEDDNFCISCGEELGLYKNRGNIQGISTRSNQSYGNETPKDYRYNYTGKQVNNGEIQLASLGSRMGAYIIDTLVVFVLVILVLSVIASIEAVYLTDDLYNLLAYLVYITVFFGYFILLEGPLGKGRTVGKRALKLRVVKEDYSRIGYGASFLRNILRLIDGLFFYIIGIILISDSDLNQRLGDRAADTIVIKGNKEKKEFRSIHY